eukprot:gnl/TRDRNA2_/TRDRNA2_148885_c2_seq1.p1 gnl/TRDRNA2_/TRDRNA2_148885_c2~~gnl/TRDRNA2_/TRDRNA2_148885_c2_seq1.p1  ORF type:complete len:386 (-),score=56.85 gnl/TRDRNA2_/TRDRNA2_148885_c2_seq1:663-1682(-)
MLAAQMSDVNMKHESIREELKGMHDSSTASSSSDETTGTLMLAHHLKELQASLDAHRQSTEEMLAAQISEVNAKHESIREELKCMLASSTAASPSEPSAVPKSDGAVSLIGHLQDSFDAHQVTTAHMLAAQMSYIDTQHKSIRDELRCMLTTSQPSSPSQSTVGQKPDMQVTSSKIDHAQVPLPLEQASQKHIEDIERLLATVARRERETSPSSFGSCLTSPLRSQRGPAQLTWRRGSQGQLLERQGSQVQFAERQKAFGALRDAVAGGPSSPFRSRSVEPGGRVLTSPSCLASTPEQRATVLPSPSFPARSPEQSLRISTASTMSDDAGLEEKFSSLA